MERMMEPQGIVHAVRKVIMGERKNHRKRWDCTLRINDATNKKEIGPYAMNDATPIADDLAFRWGTVAIERDDTLPDGFAVLVLRPPVAEVA
jgi:hypothetical protein